MHVDHTGQEAIQQGDAYVETFSLKLKLAAHLQMALLYTCMRILTTTYLHQPINQHRAHANIECLMVVQVRRLSHTLLLVRLQRTKS